MKRPPALWAGGGRCLAGSRGPGSAPGIEDTAGVRQVHAVSGGLCAVHYCARWLTSPNTAIAAAAAAIWVGR